MILIKLMNNFEKKNGKQSLSEEGHITDIMLKGPPQYLDSEVKPRGKTAGGGV